MSILTNAERIELGLSALDRAKASIADELAAMPCGCPACDNGVQPGHFACEQADAWSRVQEAKGEMVRYYNGTSWVWAFVHS